MTLPVLGILISGRGSNMKALIEATQSGELPATVGIVVSNNPEAPGLAVAREAGIEAVGLALKDFDSRDAFEEHIVALLRDKQVSLVALAGYMRLIGQPLLQGFPNRIVNIHPSLLPMFKGLHAQRQAVEAGVTESGCTVHFVNEELDAGAIIMQAKVPVYPDDTDATLSARILEQEHRLYPRAIQSIL